MFARARPPQAIIAMFSLLLRFWPRRKAGAPAIAPTAASEAPTISRRVIRYPRPYLVIFFITCSLILQVK